ncbi:glycosyltransferase 87 family protein [Actinomadura madurae]|nr:glycosyltransferase 87 family protein [Actinomadura madurae]
MAATGHDPYRTSADDLPKDPVAGAPEEWRTTPSVYGPIATGGQAFAAWLGSGSVRLTVFVLSVLNTVAFAATSLILYRTSRSEERRLRTALLWTCNPLVLFHLIAGAHNDVLAIAPMVAALAVAGGRTSWARGLAAGALAGIGTAIKLPAALVAGGPAWALLRETWTERRWRPIGALVALVAGGVAVTALSYVLAARTPSTRSARRATWCRSRRPGIWWTSRSAAARSATSSSSARCSSAWRCSCCCSAPCRRTTCHRTRGRRRRTPRTAASPSRSSSRGSSPPPTRCPGTTASAGRCWRCCRGRGSTGSCSRTPPRSASPTCRPARPPGSGCRTTWSGCSPSFGRPSFRGRCWRS